MIAFMTKSWFLFRGKSRSSTFTIALRRTRYSEAFSFIFTSRFTILSIWFGRIFRHVLWFAMKIFVENTKENLFHFHIVLHRTNKRTVRNIQSDEDFLWKTQFLVRCTNSAGLYCSKKRILQNKNSLVLHSIWFKRQQKTLHSLPSGHWREACRGF